MTPAMEKLIAGKAPVKMIEEQLRSEPLLLNSTNEQGETPLMIAVSQDPPSREVVELLLGLGAEVNACDGEGDTALHKCLAKVHLDVAELLVRAGANINIRDTNGVTPLHIITAEENLEAFNFLLAKKVEVDPVDVDGESPLLNACVNGSTEMVMKLLAAGADPNRSADDGSTPLYKSSKAGHEAVVDLLLEAGADKDKPGVQNCTPLFIAAQNNRKGVVASLLKAGCDVDKAREAGYTPLFLACQQGHKEVTQMLLLAGASTEKCNAAGASPLHVAAGFGNKDMVEILLEAGAVKDSLFDGKTPEQMATTAKHKDIVDMIRDWVVCRDFVVGSRVVLQSIKDFARLGVECIVIKITGKGRVIVQIQEGQNKEVSVKAESLLALFEAGETHLWRKQEVLMLDTPRPPKKSHTVKVVATGEVREVLPRELEALWQVPEPIAFEV